MFKAQPLNNIHEYCFPNTFQIKLKVCTCINFDDKFEHCSLFTLHKFARSAISTFQGSRTR